MSRRIRPPADAVANPKAFLDVHTRTLMGALTRSRRACLWAIYERKPDKAAMHATKAARYARLIWQRQAKLAGTVFTK